jgi:hypothetical protein
LNLGLKIFGSEVWNGDHHPLVLGWRDDQLTVVVKALAPLLPRDLVPGMRYAIAACARSLVVDTGLYAGHSLRFSRRKEHYRGPKRYRHIAPYYSWHYVTHAMDTLHQAGLIGQDLGVWGGGRQSVAWPSELLLELLKPEIDFSEQRAVPHFVETVVLRDRDDKRKIDYIDTPDTIAMRAEVEVLNDALSRLRLYQSSKPFPIPLMSRIFNGDFRRGGRCYCRGISFQNIWAKRRLDLQLLIDGVLHPVVEIDYANLHAVMAYTKAGLPIPPGDQYEIDGFDRLVVKRAFNVMLNATKRHKAVAALVEDLHHKDDELWEHSGLATRLRSECYPFAKKVVAAIEEKHRPIAESFGSDCGAGFMRRDSDMAVRVMLRMIAITGRCPLPVHDSFLVADIDQEALTFVMQEVASEEGLPLCLKASRVPCH